MAERRQYQDAEWQARRRDLILDLWAQGLGQNEIAEQVGEFGHFVGWIVAKARTAGDRRATRHGSFRTRTIRLSPDGQGIGPTPRPQTVRIRRGLKFPASVDELAAIARASDAPVTKCPRGIPFTGIPSWA